MGTPWQGSSILETKPGATSPTPADGTGGPSATTVGSGTARTAAMDGVSNTTNTIRPTANTDLVRSTETRASAGTGVAAVDDTSPLCPTQVLYLDAWLSVVEQGDASYR